MGKNASVPIALVIMTLSGTVTAGRLAYDCEVINVYHLSEKGELALSSWQAMMTGAQFHVSRLSGEITGRAIPTLNAKSVQVVNQGSEENSFKSVADFGKQYQILEVQEFREGETKPFVASSMGGAGIVTGVCK